MQTIEPTCVKFWKVNGSLSPNGVTVRFIPEPFAAFQYYRYGIRHPLVAQKGQMNVLVIDFGGGTCDVCVIETTKDGDISGGGRNKRPLAGKSLPIGGFAINRALAELLLRKVPSGKRASTKDGPSGIPRLAGREEINRNTRRSLSNLYRIFPCPRRSPGDGEASIITCRFRLVFISGAEVQCFGNLV